jgi:hypothetical protein
MLSTTKAMRRYTICHCHPFFSSWRSCRFIRQSFYYILIYVPKTDHCASNFASFLRGSPQRKLCGCNQFLIVLLFLQASTKVHIISHSMGNRVTSEALLHPSYNRINSAQLGQLVFAAADEDAEIFTQTLAQLSAFGASSSQASNLSFILMQGLASSSWGIPWILRIHVG